MKLLFWRRDPAAIDEHDAKLREAQARAHDLVERGERLSASLHARRSRNHWGETVVEIARGGKPG